MVDYTDINAKADEIRVQISNLKELISNSYSGIFTDKDRNGDRIVCDACLNACDDAWNTMWAVEEFNNILSDAFEKKIKEVNDYYRGAQEEY